MIMIEYVAENVKIFMDLGGNSDTWSVYTRIRGRISWSNNSNG